MISSEVKSNNSKIFDIVIVMVLVIFALVTLFPFMYIFALSFSSREAVLAGNVSIWPVGFNFDAYRRIITYPKFWVGYKNTILYTLAGTTLGLFFCTLAAYPLSKKKLKGKSVFTKLLVFTMFFSGGLIPNFVLINKLGMYNTFWALVLPGAINAYYIIIMRTFFEGIPDELEEAASIDGLNDLGILFRIYLPLSKSIMATIGLFLAVYIWNDWFQALIYISESDKYPVMMFLRNIVMGQQLAAQSGQFNGNDIVQVTTPTLRGATIILVTLPILMVYPFAQKYFVKGVLIGSVKG